MGRPPEHSGPGRTPSAAPMEARTNRKGYGPMGREPRRRKSLRQQTFNYMIGPVAAYTDYLELNEADEDSGVGVAPVARIWNLEPPMLAEPENVWSKPILRDEEHRPLEDSSVSAGEPRYMIAMTNEKGVAARHRFRGGCYRRPHLELKQVSFCNTIEAIDLNWGPAFLWDLLSMKFWRNLWAFAACCSAMPVIAISAAEATAAMAWGASALQYTMDDLAVRRRCRRWCTTKYSTQFPDLSA
jgi:hypothetical protein